MAYHSTTGTRPATDALTDAMTISLIITGFLLYGLYTVDVSLMVLLTASVVGFVWTFTITPYLIARWFNTDVDTLLNIQPQPAY